MAFVDIGAVGVLSKGTKDVTKDLLATAV